MKNKLIAPTIGSAIAAVMSEYMPEEKPKPTNKRKLRECMSNQCNNMTDHKGGYCSSECARGEV